MKWPKWAAAWICFEFWVSNLIRHSSFWFRVLILASGFLRLYRILRHVHRVSDRVCHSVAAWTSPKRRFFISWPMSAKGIGFCLGSIEMAGDLDGEGVLLDSAEGGVEIGEAGDADGGQGAGGADNDQVDGAVGEAGEVGDLAAEADFAAFVEIVHGGDGGVAVLDGELDLSVTGGLFGVVSEVHDVVDEGDQTGAGKVGLGEGAKCPGRWRDRNVPGGRGW